MIHNSDSYWYHFIHVSGVITIKFVDIMFMLLFDFRDRVSIMFYEHIKWFACLIIPVTDIEFAIDININISETTQQANKAW